MTLLDAEIIVLRNISRWAKEGAELAQEPELKDAYLRSAHQANSERNKKMAERRKPRVELVPVEEVHA